MMVKWSLHCVKFSLNFLELIFVLVLVFILGCFVVQCFVGWGFHFPKLVVHFGWAAFVC